jgi:transposase-like protein
MSAAPIPIESATRKTTGKHSAETRSRALELLEEGRSVSSVAKELHIGRDTLRGWRDGTRPRRSRAKEPEVQSEPQPEIEGEVTARVGGLLLKGAASDIGMTLAVLGFGK